MLELFLLLSIFFATNFLNAMKKLIFALLFLSLTNSYVNNGYANDELKINNKLAIIDVDKIIQEAVVVIDIQKKVEKKKALYEEEINKKQSSLLVEQKKIQDKKNITSPDAFDKEVQNFENKVDNLKNFVDRKQNNLKKASLDAMSKVNDHMKEIVTNIAKEQQIAVVIPASQVLYFQENLDITSEVLSRLNKKLTKIEVKFEN
jgi:Skp family chaperone for outer membrane proteins